MLRFRLDLSACRPEPRDPFWRLERNGILHKTLHEYVRFLLNSYGVSDVQGVAYLEGTLLLDNESPAIIRDGDLVRIMPRQVPPPPRGHTEDNSTVSFAMPSVPKSDITQVSNPGSDPSAAVTMEFTDPESASAVDETDPSGGGDAEQKKKRKRGKRQSRTRSKRVSFDLTTDESQVQGSGDAFQSTPYNNADEEVNLRRTPTGATDPGHNQSEAYLTALACTPGVSNHSKKAISKKTRKLLKAQSGVGYFLNMLAQAESGNAGEIASGTTTSSPDQANPIRSSSVEPLCAETGGKDIGDHGTLVNLQPQDTISCAIGIFDIATAKVETFTGVVLKVLENSLERKYLIVKHLEGEVPAKIIGTDFRVDWGLVSCLKVL